jgi:hypothetical protein
VRYVVPDSALGSQRTGSRPTAMGKGVVEWRASKEIDLDGREPLRAADRSFTRGRAATGAAADVEGRRP